MGGAETIAGGRRGPGRLKLLITAPGSARMGAEACFSVWSFFPALPLPKLHLSGNALSQIFRTGTPAGCWCGNCCQGAVLSCFYGRE